MDNVECVYQRQRLWWAISFPFQFEVFHALNREAFAQQILSQCDSEEEAAKFHHRHKKRKKTSSLVKHIYPCNFVPHQESL